MFWRGGGGSWIKETAVEEDDLCVEKLMNEMRMPQRGSDSSAMIFNVVSREQRIEEALEKNKRLLIDAMSSSDTEELEEVVANSDQRKAKKHSSNYSSQQIP